jgi:hypothetical protein
MLNATNGAVNRIGVRHSDRWTRDDERSGVTSRPANCPLGETGNPPDAEASFQSWRPSPSPGPPLGTNESQGWSQET